MLNAVLCHEQKFPNSEGVMVWWSTEHPLDELKKKEVSDAQ
jgi:hypothetical protein